MNHIKLFAHILLPISLACIPAQSNALTDEQKTQQYHAAYTTAQKVTQNNIIKTNAPIDFMQQHANNPNAEEAFHVFDISKVVERYQFWHEHLPNIQPFYAMKTNPDPVLVHVLGALGAGFDCASINEIKKALSAGAPPEKIIFAHTRKSPRAIQQAYTLGVNQMTFDSMEELKKIQRLAPEAQLVLRIKTNDSQSLTPLSDKFGANMQEAKHLLHHAYENQMHIKGISFHVGSNTTSVDGYLQALEDSLQLIHLAKTKYNQKMTLLDLGGGWPGANDELFIHISQTIQSWLTQHNLSEFSIIAEPGRYFSTPVMHSANQIIGKEVANKDNQRYISYYLADGAFGLYMASMYYQYDSERLRQEGWDFRPLTLKKGKLYSSTLWGPTCDSGDYISKNWPLPELETGDYLYSDNVGAYTIAVQNNFNDIPHSKAYYLWTQLS